MSGHMWRCEMAENGCKMVNDWTVRRRLNSGHTLQLRQKGVEL